ncbi:unnamed protein product [Hyaloperonospora brassicae]|uniref:DET1- and DDB1-associated protein 1 domain-containing protein n=1 Tax=Hyaloperonospora brassicae TaxID=162125 RepID=A0AAV0U067_HYABA|nr:unnamed protein product [Hyaloperonospora brassicae]
MTPKRAQALTASWPTSSATNFSNLPQDRRGKMILTPKPYYATHDTMPPPTPVIPVLATLSIASDRPQAAGAHVAGKRDNGDEASNPRPRKQYRP